MLVWSLSVTVAYNDGSWSGSEYTYHRGTLLTNGPDVSSLPEVKALWTKLGLTPKSDSPFTTQYNSVVFRFMSIYTNSYITVLGTTEKLEITSNDQETVIAALSANTEFSGNFLAGGSIEQALISLNSRFSEITDLVPDCYFFDDGFSSSDFDSFPLGSGVCLLPNGKTIWCGMCNDRIRTWFAESDWEGFKGNVIRFNSDGSRDTTFNLPVFRSDDYGYVRRVGYQSDGKLIIVGHFDAVNGTDSNRIARLNVDGTLDETFSSNIGNGFNNHALDVKVLNDDSILVCGLFNGFDGNNVSFFTKLNSDGTLNTSFNDNVVNAGVLGNPVHTIAVDNSGKILVGGTFTKKMYRFNSDGTLDNGFDIGSGFNNRVSCIAVLPSDKIMVGGWFTTYNGSNCNLRIVRLNDDGSLDGSFEGAADGLNQPDGSVMTLAVQNDGKVVVGGWFNSYDGAKQNLLIRFNTDGTKDDTFNVQYGFDMINDDYYNRVMHLVIDSNNGNIHLAHSQYRYKLNDSFGYTRINSSGDYLSSDPAILYDNNRVLDDGPIVMSMVKTSDNKFIIAGDSGRRDRGYMLRKVDSAGNDVAGFTPTVTDYMIRSVALQSTGKIIIGGDFNYVNGVYSRGLCRLNSNGTVDTSFFNIAEDFHFTSSVLKVEVTDDDSIWVGGIFTGYGAGSPDRLVKLMPNGDVDLIPSVSLGGAVHAIKSLSSGKVYVGGQFGNKIIRLNADGSEDTGFNVGSGFSDGIGNSPRVAAIQVQNDGKVVVGHWYTSYNGSATNPGVTRLLSDGTVDSSFATDGQGLYHTDTRGLVQDLAIQSDGKILLGGWFDEYDSNPQRKLIRLNSDGSRDASFNIGYGFNQNYDYWAGSRIQAVITEGTTIYAAGTVAWYDDSVKFYAVKINANGSLDNSFNIPLVFGLACIEDGSNDMYDTGNFIDTNLTQPYYTITDYSNLPFYSIPYTHVPTIDMDDAPYWDGSVDNYSPVPTGVIKPGDEYFGPSSQYFTNMYPGLFVMMAKNISINDFYITGNLGSDGNGTVTVSALNINVGGNQYTAFIKTNTDNSNSDPSVNHIIIVAGDGAGVTRQYNNDGSADDDGLFNISSNELYYLLVSNYPPTGISDEVATNVATKFLQIIKGA